MTSLSNQVMQDMEKSQADEAWALHQHLVGLAKSDSINEIDSGGDLWVMFENKYYKTLGYETFESYLASPEVGISRATAYKRKSVYKRFVVELGCKPEKLHAAGVQKLSVIQKYVDEDNVDAWIVLAESLSRSDLKDALADRFPGTAGKRFKKRLLDFEEWADVAWSAYDKGDITGLSSYDLFEKYQEMKLEKYGSSWRKHIAERV